MQWIGHSATLIQTPGLSIVADPFLFDSIRPPLLGPSTVTNPAVLMSGLPTIDVVLISHNHYDHLDLRSLRALVDRQRANPPTILFGRGVGALLKALALCVCQSWTGMNR